MRVVFKQGFAARTLCCHPVVAAHTVISGCHLVQGLDLGNEVSQRQSAQRIEVAVFREHGPRPRGQKVFQRLCTEIFTAGQCHKLLCKIGLQEPGVNSYNVVEILCLPWLGNETEPLKLEGQVVFVLLYECVDAFQISFGQRLLLIDDTACQKAPDPGHADQPHPVVKAHHFTAAHLGQGPARHAPECLHLPQTVLRMHIPLSHEQILFRARIDVGNAILVPDNLHTPCQPGYRRFAFYLGKTFIQEDRHASCQYAGTG